MYGSIPKIVTFEYILLVKLQVTSTRTRRKSFFPEPFIVCEKKELRYQMDQAEHDKSMKLNSLVVENGETLRSVSAIAINVFNVLAASG